MGFIILILIIIVIYVLMKNSKKSTSNSVTQEKNSRQNKPLMGIDLSQVPSYNPIQVMVLLGCLAYYDCILRNDIFLIAGMESKEATEGISITMRFDNLQHTLHFVPEDLSSAVDLVPWEEKNNEGLKIVFPSLGKNDFLSHRNEYLEYFIEGIHTAQRCSGNFLNVDNPTAVYVVIPNPNNEHMLIIDSHGPSGGPYDDMYNRIF